MGGAFGRVPQDATPLPGHAARYWLNIYGYWDDLADDQARTAFIRGLAAEMGPFAAGGRYVNFMVGDDDAQRPTYGPGPASVWPCRSRAGDGGGLHDPVAGRSILDRYSWPPPAAADSLVIIQM